MGYRDTDWVTAVDDAGAPEVDLPYRLKSVLIAVCLRTDDRNHSTYWGQKKLAATLGASSEKVRDALAELESLGVITRQAQHGNRGYRTTDLITVNTSWRADIPAGKKPNRNSARQENGQSPTQEIPKPSTEILGAEEITPVITQMDNSDTPTAEEKRRSLFDQAYAHWPRKVSREEAVKRFMKLTPSDALDAARGIVAHGDAYAAWPKDQLQYVPHLSTWLNNRRWTDEELPLPRSGPTTKTDMARAAHEELMRRSARTEQKELTR